ncbi:MAG: EamA family transporter [Cytophagales bacterium]|nr:EamA family transporter [Cytophagales bacterium]
MHFLVLIWGFTAILGKLIEIPSVEVVFYRTLIAALVLYVWLRFRVKALGLSSKRAILKQMGTGIIIAAHWVLFFLSARVSNVSVCLAGLATCSLWTAILEPLYYKKKVRPFDIVLGLIALTGMLIIFNVEMEFWLGLVLGISSAFLASIFTIINAEFVRKGNNHFVVTFYEMAGAFLAIVLFLPFYYSIQGGVDLSPSISDWAWLLILSIVCTVYAYSISVKLMKDISPFVMNLTVNLEPVYGIILAILIFGDSEEMSSGFYLGGSLILLAVLIYPILNKHLDRKPLDNRHTAL